MFFIQGLLLGLAYVIPIGTQNIYLINTALANKFSFSYITAAIVIVMDISLALSCFYGIGFIINKVTFLKIFMLFTGSVFLFWIGIKLFRQKKIELAINKREPLNVLKVVRDAFIVTWLNPQAILDGSLLFGSYRASLSPDALSLFITGICAASASWFFSLATIIGCTKKILSEQIFLLINKICGLLLVFFGANLFYNFIINMYKLISAGE